MRRTIKGVVTAIGLYAAVITILFAYTQSGQAGKLAVGILAGFYLLLMVAFAVQEYRLSRKARYSEILSQFGDVFIECQQKSYTLAQQRSDPTPIDDNDNQLIADSILESCHRIVDQLASSFSLITGTRCSTCIKLITNAPDTEKPAAEETRLQVKTLRRDSSSSKKRRRGDQSDVIHWLDQNSDFEELHKQAGTAYEKFFFANYLPAVRNYKNSSFEVYGYPRRVDLPFVSGIVRYLTWRLPYKSTIVAAICPNVDLLHRGDESENRVAGYLCVDSRSQGVFNRRYDLEVITSIADCLYELLQNYRETVWAERASTQEEEI